MSYLCDFQPQGDARACTQCGFFIRTTSAKVLRRCPASKEPPPKLTLQRIHDPDDWDDDHLPGCGGCH